MKKPKSKQAESKKPIVSPARYAWLSVATALATMGLKAWAYALTDSIGLLSDALESSVNLVAALIALFALSVAGRPPDAGHHYGHGKAEYFSSAFEGLLILVAAVLIVYTAWQRLLLPHVLQSLDLGLSLSLGASLLNLITAKILRSAARRHRSIALEADAAHLLTDVWTSFGVVAGLGLAWVTGEYILDPVLAMLVALHIAASGVKLIIRSMHGLLDGTLSAEDNECVLAVLERHRQREGIDFHDLRTREAGSQRFISLHVLVPGDMPVKYAHDLVERIEADIRLALPHAHVTTHIEPLDDATSYHD